MSNQWSLIHGNQDGKWYKPPCPSANLRGHSISFFFLTCHSLTRFIIAVHDSFTIGPLFVLGVWKEDFSYENLFHKRLFFEQIQLSLLQLWAKNVDQVGWSMRVDKVVCQVGMPVHLAPVRCNFKKLRHYNFIFIFVSPHLQKGGILRMGWRKLNINPCG